MDSAVTDRRCGSRFGAPLLVHVRATLRPGNDVVLVNLGSGGALVQSRRPLRPGARIHVQIIGGTRPLRIAGRVLRCGVASLSAADGVLYVGALRFDNECDLPWAGRTPAGR